VSDERPFAGVTVLEFGHFIAVPWAGQVLADGGAHVIKVEPLEGEPSRHIAPIGGGESRHFLIRNRGKHALPLDLRHPHAREILDALLARADVVLANMRPGLAAELGLEYDQLAPRFPRLVVGTVTAFGAKGPDAALAGMDYVVQARSGLMVTGGRTKDDLPATGESPIADYMAAALLAFGVASALFQRERTGRGSRVDTSLLLAALALQNNLMVRVDGLDAARHETFRDWLASARSGGVPFAEQVERMPRNRVVSSQAIYTRTYATKDAALAIACGSPSLRRKFMAAVGLKSRTDLARGAGLKVNRGIVVNRNLQTSDADIYALGDCMEIEGLVMPYVMPIMHASRALGATLAGKPTAVSFPAMPVMVKTPACPTIVSPPAPGAAGEWKVEQTADGVKSLYVDASGKLLGFALNGTATAERAKLAPQLPPVLAAT